MAWHDSTVPGQGWIQLRATVARLTTEYIKFVAEVRVNTETPIWRFYNGENFWEIQKAIMGRLRTVNIIQGAIQRKDRAMRRIEAPRSPGHEGWLEYWRETLQDEAIIEVLRWDVTTPRRPMRRR